MIFKFSVLKKTSYTKGFTLIELLVVLGILGILAAALLAAINPVEQLNKANDASIKEAASQFVTANTSYYSTHNAFPWFTVANGGANCYASGNVLGNGTTTTVTLTALSGCVTSLVTAGELKSSFQNLNTSIQNQIDVNEPGGVSSDLSVCFQPKSQSQQLDPNTKYNQYGGAGNSCKSQNGTNNCYWCAQ
ncbi:MAG TPA: prepilin-type N-terminal cleavage/methylation domain-containing protein [Candidatus Saccharimonadales bacterium]|nr:prepilin-type N-terminal cleavage/methylation domain-containing protein [Candidatus Saccharimonadales bacterium]